MLELLAPVPVLCAVAEYLDDQGRVHSDQPALWVVFDRATDDGEIGIADEPGRQHADFQVRAERPARPFAQLRPNERRDRRGQCGVFRRAAGHGIDLSVEELMLHIAAVLVCEVVSERVAMMALGRLVHRCSHPGTTEPTMSPVISSPASDAGGRRSVAVSRLWSSTKKIASIFAQGGSWGRFLGR